MKYFVVFHMAQVNILLLIIKSWVISHIIHKKYDKHFLIIHEQYQLMEYILLILYPILDEDLVIWK